MVFCTCMFSIKMAMMTFIHHHVLIINPNRFHYFSFIQTWVQTFNYGREYYVQEGHLEIRHCLIQNIGIQCLKTHMPLFSLRLLKASARETSDKRPVAWNELISIWKLRSTCYFIESKLFIFALIMRYNSCFPLCALYI